jgi:hypothetical protein
VGADYLEHKSISKISLSVLVMEVLLISEMNHGCPELDVVGHI